MNMSLHQPAGGMNADRGWKKTIVENLGTSAVPAVGKHLFSFPTLEGGMGPCFSGIQGGRFIQPTDSGNPS
jgi:hypothetical protein